jgi:putative hydroxymethylpyrimidine transport system permease protein
MKRLSPFLLALALLAIWEACVHAFGVPAYVLPAPSRIALVFFTRFPLLLSHAGATVAEIGLGLLVGSLAGASLALALFYVPTLEAAVYPILIGSQVIPVFAIAPLLVIWFGYGIWPKVAVAAVISFFPITVNAVDGLRAAGSETIDVLRALRASEWQTFWMVRAPASLPAVFSGLKVGVTQSVVGATIGEWIGAKRGLGYLMIESNALLRTDLVFAAILALTLVGLLLFVLVRIIERRVLRWRRAEGGGHDGA